MGAAPQAPCATKRAMRVRALLSAGIDRDALRPRCPAKKIETIRWGGAGREATENMDLLLEFDDVEDLQKRLWELRELRKLDAAEIEALRLEIHELRAGREPPHAASLAGREAVHTAALLAEKDAAIAALRAEKDAAVATMLADRERAISTLLAEKAAAIARVRSEKEAALVELQAEQEAAMAALRNEKNAVIAAMHAELARAREKLELEKERMMCPVCIDAPCDRALACGHVFCEACVLKLPTKRCPACRKAFTAKSVRTLFM